MTDHALQVDRALRHVVHWRLIALALALTILIAALPAPAMGPGVTRAAAQGAWAPPTTVYLERTGHTLDGLFLDLWRQHGTLLGEPVTEEFRAGTAFSDEDVTVQYFEHVALAWLPDEVAGEQVRLLPLGRSMALQPRIVHADAFAPVRAGRCDDDCELVVRTRHTVSGDAREFWRTDDGQLLGDPLSEPFRTGGREVQYFENGALVTDGPDGVEPLPLGTDAARQLGYDTDRIDRPDGVPAYDPTLFVEPEVIVADEAPPTTVDTANEAVDDVAYGPGPQQGGVKEIVISISASAIWAYDDGDLLLSSLVSTGVGDIPETVTPIGSFSILTKYDVQTMSGILGGEAYEVPDVPWVMYFDNLGNALHGAYWHNNFGTPMSHGCVNLPMDVAPVLYAWADIGTPVTVLP